MGLLEVTLGVLPHNNSLQPTQNRYAVSGG